MSAVKRPVFDSAESRFQLNFWFTSIQISMFHAPRNGTVYEIRRMLRASSIICEIRVFVFTLFVVTRFAPEVWLIRNYGRIEGSDLIPLFIVWHLPWCSELWLLGNKSRAYKPEVKRAQKCVSILYIKWSYACEETTWNKRRTNQTCKETLTHQLFQDKRAMAIRY